MEEEKEDYSQELDREFKSEEEIWGIGGVGGLKHIACRVLQRHRTYVYENYEQARILIYDCYPEILDPFFQENGIESWEDKMKVLDQLIKHEEVGYCIVNMEPSMRPDKETLSGIDDVTKVEVGVTAYYLSGYKDKARAYAPWYNEIGWKLGKKD